MEMNRVLLKLSGEALGQSINNKEHFCFTHRTIEPHEDRSIEFSDGKTVMGCFKCEARSWRRTIRYINEPSWYAD